MRLLLVNNLVGTRPRSSGNAPARGHRRRSVFLDRLALPLTLANGVDGINYAQNC